MTIKSNLIIGILLGTLLGIYLHSIDIKSVMEALYSISGIMFSISMSLIVTFNTSEIINKKIRNRIVSSLKASRNKHIFFFLLVSICYIASSFLEVLHINMWKEISFNSYFLSLTYLILSIIYYIQSFISIQKFREDLDNQIIKEKNKAVDNLYNIQ